MAPGSSPTSGHAKSEIMSSSSPAAPTPSSTNSNGKPNGTLRPRGPPRPNYNKIHARKLPFEIFPLPTFQPNNPLSLLPLVYAIVRDFILPRSSNPQKPYQGHFSLKTRSVHVTDPTTIRALWEAGFFGKGSLSRSEPNWLEAEKRRLGMTEALTAEEYSLKRRKEREEFKRERARIEKEMVEEQRDRETRGLPSNLPRGEAIPTIAGTRARELMDMRSQATTSATTTQTAMITAVPPVLHDITNQEHLQLSLFEAFFLVYALGVLDIKDLPPSVVPSLTDKARRNWSLLQLFRQLSYFPSKPLSTLQPDDPFVLNYVFYHHYRSHGWVPRDGTKFGVDFLLYERGVVFDHATFAVIIVPSYSDPWWFATEERKKKVELERKRKSWSWFHCANRVQTAVVKTLVIGYVDIPGADKVDKVGENVGAVLKLYRVREFCVKRWSANRNR